MYQTVLREQTEIGHEGRKNDVRTVDIRKNIAVRTEYNSTTLQANDTFLLAECFKIFPFQAIQIFRLIERLELSPFSILNNISKIIET